MLRIATICFGLVIMPSLLSGCEEYATAEALREMESEVEDIQVLTRSAQKNNKRNNHEVRLKLSQIEYRQAQTEQAFSQMGDGFNLLVETVSIADAKTEQVARKQYKLQRKIEQELAADTTASNGIDLAATDGVWWADAESLSNSTVANDENRITIDFGNNQLITQESPGAARVFYEIESWGNRLYATKGETAKCLVVLSIDEHFIRAVDCNKPMIRYQFSPLQ